MHMQTQQRLHRYNAWKLEHCEPPLPTVAGRPPPSPAALHQAPLSARRPPQEMLSGRKSAGGLKRGGVGSLWVGAEVKFVNNARTPLPPPVACLFCLFLGSRTAHVQYIIG